MDLSAAELVLLGMCGAAFGSFVNQTFEESSTCLAYTGVGEPDC